MATHTAFITGAGKNIGRACALELAGRGYNVVINGRADKAACAAVAKEAQSTGVKTHVIMADVGLVAEARRAAQEALATFGTIDVLVANAAIRPDKPFLENTEEDWRRVMGTNLESSIFLSQAFLPGMIAQKWGRIVVMTGRNAMRGYPGHVTTSVAKHGLWGLTKTPVARIRPAGRHRQRDLARRDRHEHRSGLRRARAKGRTNGNPGAADRQARRNRRHVRPALLGRRRLRQRPDDRREWRD